jgi:hypothetical protein
MQWMKMQKWPMPLGATRTPEIFLLDATGKVLYKGAIDDNPSEADNVKTPSCKRSH